jgi:hypothetical protein
VKYGAAFPDSPSSLLRASRLVLRFNNRGLLPRLPGYCFLIANFIVS